MSTLLGGWLGNRGDFWLCKGTNKLYSRIKENIDEPTNHHIQRAIRKSYLKATLMAVKHIESQRKWYKLSDARWSNIKKVEKYVKNQINQTGNEKDNVRSSLIDESHRDILFPKDGSSADRMDELINNLKQSIINELEGGRRKVESTLKDCIMNGWTEDPKEMNFYKLTCAFFTQELKDNTELSTYIQTEYLDSIQSELGEVKLTMSLLRTTLDLFYEEYKEVLPLLRKIYTSLEEVKESLEDLPVKTAALVLKEIKDNNITPRQISISEEYQKYIADIHRLREEVQSINQQIDGVKNALNSVDESIKPVLQQNIENLGKQQLQKSGEKNKLEQVLDAFVQNIIQLSKQLNYTPSNQSEESNRLTKARALFEEGKYTELNTVLNEEEIDKEINLLKEKSQLLARELTIKAQSIIITKPDDWYEEANRLYTKALDVIENYNTTFSYGIFLQNHKQAKKAIKLYEKSLHYITDEFEKSIIYNNQGILLGQIREFDQAEKLLYEAIEIRKKLTASEPDNYIPYLSNTWHNLANLLIEKKQLSSAASAFKEVFKIFQEYGKNKNLLLNEFATLLSDFGNLQSAQKNYTGAIESYQQSLEIRRKLVGIASKSFANDLFMSLNNLGTCYREWKNHDEAKRVLQEALDLIRKLANENPYVNTANLAMVLINIGALQWEVSDLENAEISLVESLSLYRSLNKITPNVYLPQIAACLHNLGNVSLGKHKLNQAVKYYNESLELYRQLTNKDSLYQEEIARGLNGLGLVYHRKKELDESESLYKESIDIFRNLPNSDKLYLPELSRSLSNLGSLKTDKQEYAESIKYLLEALSIRKKLAIEYPKTYLASVSNTLYNLGRASWGQKKYEKIEGYFKEALNIYHNNELSESYKLNEARICIALSVYYKLLDVNMLESIKYATIALESFKGFSDKVPFVEKWTKEANDILEFWRKNSDNNVHDDHVG